MLHNIGLGGLLVITLVVLVLFGRGRIGGLMTEVGVGIARFRRGLRGGEAVEAGEVPRIEAPDRANG